MKKQTMTTLEQTRKSSNREQIALHRAKESFELKEAATSNATRSAQRENYMLDLMTDASQDMAGMSLMSYCLFAVFLCLSVSSIAFPFCFL
jgi:hypothetical protein